MNGAKILGQTVAVDWAFVNSGVGIGPATQLTACRQVKWPTWEKKVAVSCNVNAMK